MSKHILLSRGILNHPDLVETFKDLIKPTDKVAILAYSFFPLWLPDLESYDQYYSQGGEYYDKMMSAFEPYGILEKNIEFIHYYKDSTEDAIKKINQADIIYFPGGAPDLMMKRIEEKGLKEIIEKQDKLFIGSSAGAMIQMSEYHISPDSDYPYFSYEKGLNLLTGFSIEVHYRRRKKQKSSLRKVNRAFRHPIYAIPDDGALYVDEKGIKCLLSAFKIYQHKGINRGKL